MKKLYHIYIQDECIMHSIEEEDFEATWKSLQQFLKVAKTDYTENDLSFEEVTLQKEIYLNSSY